MQAELHFDAHQLPVHLLKRGPLPAAQAGGPAGVRQAVVSDRAKEQQRQLQQSWRKNSNAAEHLAAASLWVLVPAALCQAAVGLRAVLLKVQAQGAVCG